MTQQEKQSSNAVSVAILQRLRDSRTYLSMDNLTEGQRLLDQAVILFVDSPIGVWSRQTETKISRTFTETNKAFLAAIERA